MPVQYDDPDPVFQQPMNYGPGRCQRGLRKNIVPKNKTKKRFDYGNGQRDRLPNTKLPRNLRNVESKIKNVVAHFKSRAKHNTEWNKANKEPVILYKEPDHPVKDHIEQ